MKKEMLINVLQPEECRIAIVEDGILEELYVERTSHEGYTGNIYKGKVVNLEPAIQAAFVDFSVGRNGFLHVSDVEPQYYRRNLSPDAEPSPRDRPSRDRDRDRGDRDPRSGSGRDDRRRPARSSGEDRDLPPPPSYPEDRPSRERPDRSERGRRDRSEPRRFGEGLTDEERASNAAASAARSAPPSSRADFDPEPPRRLRSEVPPLAPPPPARPMDLPPPYARTIDRIDPSTRTYEPEESRGRGFGSGVGRAQELEPIDPDLPPSRTARNRVAPPEPTPRPTPVDRDDDSPRARPLSPAPTAQVSGRERDRDRDRLREAEPSLEAAEADTRPAREPRRGRGRGRGRSAGEVEAREVEPEPSAPPEPVEFDETDDVAFPEESPRRRGGRDAIRSRGGERERPERERDRGAEREPERTRPAPPERTRTFAAELIEPERPRAAETERPRSFEATESRARSAEVERPSRPAPEVERPSRPAPEPDTGRDRGRGGFGRGLEADAPAPRSERGRPHDRAAEERAKPHDRAGEEGYVPRRFRNAAPEPPAAGSGWVDDESSFGGGLAADTDVDADTDEGEGEDDLTGKTGEGGPRRRRRRRGRRRDRESTDRTPTTTGDEGDEDESDDLEAVADAIHEAEEILDSALEDVPSTSDFDFGDDSADHDFDDDDLPPRSRAQSPDDRIDPELEEEIRREIEEIAALEREMGLRGPVEARPRRGDRDPGPAVDDDEEEGGRGGRSGGRGGRTGGLTKPPLQEIFRRGDEVLVQVIKESIGTKGPTLSTYISIPGRYLVLMPGLNRVGVSRKIADEGQRRKLREIMNDLNPPKGLGFIVRTAGLDRTKGELARDLAYLLRLWKVILTRIKKVKTPAPIYQESDMITRTIRDIFNAEIDTIWIDEPNAFERAQEFLRVVMPRFVDRLKLYDEKVPLFHKYGIEDEIAKIQRRRVDLPEGGSIVIDQTEALVAIDVNSGNFRVENDAERTAYEMNLRAAKEIARQLRLRDLGGVIVNDFIDMKDERNRRGVENALRKAIERDRARTKVLKMSAFGLVEMTRQRIRPSLKRSVYEDCTHCAGAGVVKTVESMSIDVMRILALACHRDDVRRILIGVSPAVAAHLNNRKRKEIAQFELEANMTIHIRHEESAPAEHLQIDCFDANNGEIRLFPAPAPERHHRGRPSQPQH